MSDIPDKLKDTIEAIHRCQQEITAHPNEPTIVVNLMSFRKRLVRLADEAIAEINGLRAEIASYKNDQVLHSDTRRTAFLGAAKMAEAMADDKCNFEQSKALRESAARLRSRAAEGAKA